MDKTKYLRAFEQGMVVGARQFVSRTATLLGYACSTVSRVYENGHPNGHPANLTQLWEASESTWACIPVRMLSTPCSPCPDILRLF